MNKNRETEIVNMLKRDKKLHRVSLSITLDPALHQRLLKIAKDSETNVSRVIERLVFSVIGKDNDK